MEKKIINLSYKVKGDFSPNGLQKAFFSFHPSDIRQMEQISSDVLSIANCAIYYHTDLLTEEDVDIDDYSLKLLEMKLFVIIVTTNYLYNDSLAKNWEYGFALRHNIPILPIAVENGLEECFAVEMNRIGGGYGDVQLLNSQVKDKTEIAYKQKLWRDLNMVLVNDQDIERIRNAFSGRIFLSYRKKDRKYANELMRTIHSIPSLRSVSIWYDEFISTGEKWSERIENALKNSDVFLLMITPSITEPDNYVIKEEYPSAKKHEKMIVSAGKATTSMDAIDREKLQKLFPELKTYVDGDDSDALAEVLCRLSSSGDSSAEKDYLVGLAFFNGIEVEKDNEKAVSLIVASAKRNLPAAINKLAEMYWIGDGIPVNYENSILWRKKLVELYDQKFDGIGIKETGEMRDYVKALESLTSCLYELSSFRDSMRYGKQLVLLLEQMASSDSSSEFNQYLGWAYDLCGKNSKRLGLYDEAIVYAEKFHAFSQKRYKEEPSMMNLHNLSVSYARLGDVYFTVGDFKYAEAWYKKAIKIDKKIDEKYKSGDSAYNLSAGLLVLGDIHIRNGEYEAADKLYAEAVVLRERILDVEDSSAHRNEYGETTISRGTSLMLKGDIKTAKIFFAKAKDIYKELAEEYGTIEFQHVYSVVLNRCGKICEMEEDLSGALEYYTDSLNRRKKILSHIRTNEAVYECALAQFFKAEVHRMLYDSMNAKSGYEETVNLLLPIISRDWRGDWHRIFAEASFERFKLDTYSGKAYLQYAIDALEWLINKEAGNKQYKKQYDIYRKMYQRCYPD